MTVGGQRRLCDGFEGWLSAMRAGSEGNKSVPKSPICSCAQSALFSLFVPEGGSTSICIGPAYLCGVNVRVGAS